MKFYQGAILVYPWVIIPLLCISQVDLIFMYLHYYIVLEQTQLYTGYFLATIYTQSLVKKK